MSQLAMMFPPSCSITDDSWKDSVMYRPPFWFQDSIENDATSISPSDAIVYSGVMYINCPEGADPIEFDRRKREWLLYDSVKAFEDTFRAVIDAKNAALDQARSQQTSASWWPFSGGKAGPASSTGFKGGDASKLEAVQAQVADVNKQLAASKRTLAEMQVQLSAKSELYEKALLEKQALEMAARHKEEVHQRELQEAVNLVEELQAAALSDTKRTGRDFSGVQQRLSKLKVSSESAAPARGDMLTSPAESKATAARKTEVLDTLSKLASSDTHATEPKRSAMLHMLEKLGRSASPSPEGEKNAPPVSSSRSGTPTTTEVLGVLSKLSTPPGSSESLSSAVDQPKSAAVTAQMPKRSAMMDMLTKLATPPASEDASKPGSVRSSEPRSSRSTGGSEVLDMLTLLATPPDEDTAAATSSPHRAKSGKSSEVLDRLSQLATPPETEELTEQAPARATSVGGHSRVQQVMGAADTGGTAPRLRAVGSLAEVGELVGLVKKAADLHKFNPATASPRINQLLQSPGAVA